METWKRVHHSPAYEVSDLGRVRRDGRVLVGGVSSSGYKMLTLSEGSRYARQTADIHVLVCEAFHGPRPTTPLERGRWEVRHLNGDKLDNRAANLTWGTSKLNGEDKVAHGTSPRGEENPTAKLDEYNVVEMRRLRAAGFKLKEIAERFGVCESQVHNVVTGAQWQHALAPHTGDWRPLGIEGYEAYTINAEGRMRRKTKDGSLRTVTGEPSTGRATLLHADGSRHRFKISDLVAKAFSAVVTSPI